MTPARRHSIELPEDPARLPGHELRATGHMICTQRWLPCDRLERRRQAALLDEWLTRASTASELHPADRTFILELAAQLRG